LGLGVGAGAGEARTRAEQEGATEEQRATATALGTIPGALELFAPLRILRRIPEGEVISGVEQSVRRAFIAGGEEGAQEAASAVAQNLIAKVRFTSLTKNLLKVLESKPHTVPLSVQLPKDCLI
jgi:hypothetical protein